MMEGREKERERERESAMMAHVGSDEVLASGVPYTSNRMAIPICTLEITKTQVMDVYTIDCYFIIPMYMIKTLFLSSP